MVPSPAVDEKTRYIRGLYIQLLCKLCQLRDNGSRILSGISVNRYSEV